MMRLRYTDLAANEKALLAHTGLKADEFDALLVHFENEWGTYIRYFTFEGQPRQRRSKPRKNNTLPTPEDRLLFVLYFLKTNPLQEVLGAAFGMRQSHASEWLKLLLPMLAKALAKADALPERQGERLERALAGHDVVLIDGTERAVTRSSDSETQREHFSGKKNGTR